MEPDADDDIEVLEMLEKLRSLNYGAFLNARDCIRLALKQRQSPKPDGGVTSSTLKTA